MGEKNLLLPSNLWVHLRTLVNDLVAGMINGDTAIPNGLGGSILAGANPVHGLYSLIIGTPAATSFTASVSMNVDAISVTALATADALSGVAFDQKTSALVMLVILVGVFQIVFSLLRLGFLVRLISNAVMTEF